MGAERRVPGVLVLGMHRSGTSVATRLVNLLGPSTCVRSDFDRTTPWNPKGNWESRSLRQVNDGLLAQLGHTWWYPPPDTGHDGEAFVRLGSLIEPAGQAFARVHPSVPWVWKDPRTCLLVPFWRGALPGSVAVLVHRHPLDVANSLAKRNSLTSSFAVALWERYHRLVLRHCEGMPVLVVAYDDLVDDPLGSIERFDDFLSRWSLVSRRPDPAELLAFVEPSLRHGNSISAGQDGNGTPASAHEMLEILRQLPVVNESFEAPELPPEAASVEFELARMGPRRHPAFNRP